MAISRILSECEFVNYRQGSRRHRELCPLQRGLVDRHQRLDRLHRQVLGRQDEAPGARADFRGDEGLLLPTSNLERRNDYRVTGQVGKNLPLIEFR